MLSNGRRAVHLPWAVVVAWAWAGWAVVRHYQTQLISLDIIKILLFAFELF